MSTEIYRAVSGIVLRRLPLKSSAALINDNNLKDINRKHSEPVYLLVKKPRKHHAWQFPQGGQENNETASEAALRELEEECGPSLKVKLVDTKEPIGVYQYKFPLQFIQSGKRFDNSIGAKVSFFRADWIAGQCEPDNQEIVDFAWLTKQELNELIHSEYKQAIEPFLSL